MQPPLISRAHACMCPLQVFQPQGVAEFKRTINALFGPTATEKAPLYYCKNVKRNNLPIYKGTSEQLQVHHK